MAKKLKRKEPSMRSENPEASRNRTFRMRDAIWDALSEAARIRRQTRTVIIEVALEELLATMGLWPPGGKPKLAGGDD